MTLIHECLLLTNVTKDPGYTVTDSVAKKLSSLGILVRSPYASRLSVPATESEDPGPKTDLMIVIGGDGSILDAAPGAILHGLPILGINLGKLGYLSEVEPSELSLLDRLADGNFRIEEKMLLTYAINGEDKNVYAVNDIIFSHENAVGLTRIRLTDADGDSMGYRADGLIFATPVGSTAYSLSAGGPIVFHEVDGIALTPVCSHSLFSRSIVFPGEEELSVRSEEKQPLRITVDGRTAGSVYNGETCTVRKATKKLKILCVSNKSRLSALFKKMRHLEEF